jgi:aromatic-L-amino-acid/L-tryptophan decarboxylase
MLVEHFATLSDRKVGAKAAPSDIFSKLSEPPAENGTPYKLLFDQLQRDIFPNPPHVNHPWFFAFVPGPGNYVGVMAEALAAGYNAFVGTSLGGSAAAAVGDCTIGCVSYGAFKRNSGDEYRRFGAYESRYLTT